MFVCVLLTQFSVIGIFDFSFCVQAVVAAAVVCNWAAAVAIVFRCKCITLKSVFLVRTYWFVMTSDLR